MKKRSPIPWLLWIAALLWAGGCGSALRTPPLGPHSDTARQVAVDYPPPPAKVERLPDDPGRPCVWVDGHWEWEGRRWEWTAGNWVKPPAGCHYAPARLQWVDTASGTLYFTSPNWYVTRVDEVEQASAAARCNVELCASAPSSATDAGP